MGFFANLFKKIEPVSIMIDENTYVTVYNRSEAEFYASGMLKIANDCANLVNTTKNPKVFFERYRLLIEKMEQLSKLECFGCFTGSRPSQNLQQISDKKIGTINEFIDTYYQDVFEKIQTLKTKASKEKRIEDFYQNFNSYKDYMEPENMEKYIELYKSLLAIKN